MLILERVSVDFAADSIRINILFFMREKDLLTFSCDNYFQFWWFMKKN